MPEPFRTDVRRFPTLDSTNRYLLDEARAGAPAGVVAVADHQSAGRGRLGRRWEAPAGVNLLCSILLRPALAADERPLAGVAVALAGVEAAATAAGVDLRVKWPNDLLAADGRKVAGILAEADLTAPGPLPPPVVVGIGVNVGWPADGDDIPGGVPATSLAACAGRPVDRDALLDALLAGLGPRVGLLDTSEGRNALVDQLRRRCATLGTAVRVELAAGSFEGTATALTATGALVVDVGGERRTVVAGDVVHLRPSPLS